MSISPFFSIPTKLRTQVRVELKRVLQADPCGLDRVCQGSHTRTEVCIKNGGITQILECQLGREFTS